MARAARRPTGATKKQAKKAPARRTPPPRKDQLLPVPLKEQLQSIANHLTPRLQGWINRGAENESPLKAAKITLELMEFVQPKLTRVVMSEEESKALAKGVGAELRRQIANQLLADVETGDDK